MWEDEIRANVLFWLCNVVLRKHPAAIKQAGMSLSRCWSLKWAEDGPEEPVSRSLASPFAADSTFQDSGAPPSYLRCLNALVTILEFLTNIFQIYSIKTFDFCA